MKGEALGPSNYHDVKCSNEGCENIITRRKKLKRQQCYTCRKAQQKGWNQIHREKARAKAKAKRDDFRKLHPLTFRRKRKYTFHNTAYWNNLKSPHGNNDGGTST